MCEPPKFRNGFTLVEMMIVLFIIGMMAAAVVVTMADPADRIEEDAQRFAARTAALRDNAILQSRPMAVQVTPQGYSFLERRAGGWAGLEDKPFVTTSWSNGVVADVGQEGRVRIAFESTGLPAEPVDITLRRADSSRTVRIAALGEVALASGKP